MMTPDEIRGLLMAASLYDDRKESKALTAAWTEAASRANWTHAAAIDAVHAHYAETTDWIRPGHITERIRRNRRRFWDQ